MAGVQGNPNHSYAANDLSFHRSYAVAVIQLSARVVRKASEDLDVVAASLELLREEQSLERRLGVEPLS
jgi:hypothetical protein